MAQEMTHEQALQAVVALAEAFVVIYLVRCALLRLPPCYAGFCRYVDERPADGPVNEILKTYYQITQPI